MSRETIRTVTLNTELQNFDNRKVIGHGRTGCWNWSAVRGGHSGGAKSYAAAREQATEHAARYQQDYWLEFTVIDQPQPYEMRDTEITVNRMDQVTWTRAEPV